MKQNKPNPQHGNGLFAKKSRSFKNCVISMNLARPRGFEPLTYRFVAGHSIR